MINQIDDRIFHHTLFGHYRYLTLGHTFSKKFKTEIAARNAMAKADAESNKWAAHWAANPQT